MLASGVETRVRLCRDNVQHGLCALLEDGVGAETATVVGDRLRFDDERNSTKASQQENTQSADRQSAAAYGR